jgi:cobalt-zinc-cadmium efflux system outer membrane protein
MRKRNLIVAMLFGSRFIFSQIGTLPITLQEAETRFMKSNFLLLAQKYNVDASKALVRQAGLLNNPVIYYEQSVYNHFQKKLFPTQLGTMGDGTTQGEFIVQSNWLFSIAGKRLKSQDVAKGQADIAQYQFDDLVRSLLFALRGDFYQIYYDLQSLKLFDQEIATVNSIVKGFEDQYKKQNVSLRDLARFRSLLLSFQSDRLAVFQDLQQNMTEFSILISDKDTTTWAPVLDEIAAEAQYPVSKVELSKLLEQAFASRPDLKAALATVATAQANVKLQKAVGVPDVMIQEMYDRNGSYIPNYWAGGIQMALPVFNRNQGNIKAAKAQQDASGQMLLQTQTIVQNNVLATYQKIIETEKLYNSLSPDFIKDFEKVLAGAQSMYEKKNLSLLEFVDLFESYKASMIQYYSIKSMRFTTFEELNFNVGTDVFKQ